MAYFALHLQTSGFAEHELDLFAGSLGKRLSKPAKGFWLVPGGPVLKKESGHSFLLLIEAAQWLSGTKLLTTDDVQRHSKWYFMNEKGCSV